VIQEKKSYVPKLGYNMLRGVDDELAEASIEPVDHITEKSLDFR